MILKLKLILWSLLAAQSNLAPQDETITHTVVAGETLHSITRKYLGTDILWQDNWKLNPDIENPHLLTIGDELTVIKQRIIPAEKAKVIDVNNRVEKKPAGSDWKSAQVGDELVQQEGVRTYQKSSALLEFSDESKLKVLEFSQIFLKKRVTDLTGTDSATIEIIKGDTELNWEPLAENASEITIVMGSATSKPSVNQGHVAELRAGLTPDGDSVVSVYQGQSQVESAGSQVKVTEGMGVMVKPGQAPSAPEKLLAAPILTQADNLRYAYTNPVVTWQAVAKAKDYVFEMCADQACDLVLKEVKVDQPQWQINDFNHAGDFYFRVAGRTNQDIVGYRSKPHMISFTGEKDDLVPPVIAIDVIGQRIINDNQFVISPDSQIKLLAYDAMSGLAVLSYRWNQGEWLPANQEMIPLGEHEGKLTVMARDVLGHTAQQTYSFINQ